MDQLEDFLNYARDRLTDGDEALPCDDPADCAAVMAWLCSIVPEYQLSREADAQDIEARRTERRQAMLAGFRRARGAVSNASANGSGSRPRPIPAEAADDDGAGEAA